MEVAFSIVDVIMSLLEIKGRRGNCKAIEHYKLKSIDEGKGKSDL
jgi:hypothetical protein